MSEEYTREELEDKFDSKISNLSLDGWRILDKNEKRLECVLEKGQDFNHTVHVILTLCTCVWGIVWYLQYEKNKPKRIRIGFDKSGNLREETVSVG